MHHEDALLTRMCKYIYVHVDIYMYIKIYICIFMSRLYSNARALILVGGANDCYLAAALADVALSEQARLGKDCPFNGTCPRSTVL